MRLETLSRKTVALASAAALTTAVLAYLLNAHGASADTSGSAGSLPSARSETSAVWTGTKAYVFGGKLNGSAISEIAEVTISGGSASSSSVASFSSARSGTSAVWTGTYAYVFGGISCTGGGPSSCTYYSSIIKFDPSDNSTTSVASMPSGRALTSAVWIPSDGNSVTTHDAKAYIFGGCMDPCGSKSTGQILRFDPTTNSVVTLGESLPTDVTASSAVYVPSDGDALTTSDASAYIFGAGDGVIRYDPAGGEAFFTSAHFAAATDISPTRGGTSAVFDGQYAYLIGGSDLASCVLCPSPPIKGGYTSQVLRFDHAADRFTLTNAALPTGRSGTSAVWTPGAAYVFAGIGEVGSGVDYMSGVVRYRPAPGTPRNLVPSSGQVGTTPLGLSGTGVIGLAWTAPANSSISVTNYLIYRSLAGGTPMLHATISGGTTTFSETCPEATVCAFDYEVRASNDDGTSAPSNRVTVITAGI